MTTAKPSKERRKTPRKETSLPITFIVKDGVNITGEIVDVSCYGIKFQFLFHAAEEMDIVDKSLSTDNMTLEINNFGKTEQIHTSVNARWNVYKYAIRKRIYEVGLDIQLTGAQKRTWKKFYESL